jgi:hypothetical protein
MWYFGDWCGRLFFHQSSAGMWTCSVIVPLVIRRDVVGYCSINHQPGCGRLLFHQSSAGMWDQSRDVRPKPAAIILTFHPEHPNTQYAFFPWFIFRHALMSTRLRHSINTLRAFMFINQLITRRPFMIFHSQPTIKVVIPKLLLQKCINQNEYDTNSNEW